MSEPVAVPVVETQDVVKQPRITTTFSNFDDETTNQLSYKATNGVPYIIDYLGLREFYKISPEITDMARKLHEMMVTDDSEQVIGEMKLKLDELSQELNLGKDDSPVYKLKKIYSMMTIKNRINELESNQLKALAYSKDM